MAHKRSERRKKNKLKNEPIEKGNNEVQWTVSPESVISVYRNQREN
jgi:hypothetical protein